MALKGKGIPNTARLRRIVGWVKHSATQQIRFKGWETYLNPTNQSLRFKADPSSIDGIPPYRRSAKRSLQDGGFLLLSL